MTELLERAVETARTLSPEMQDAVARLMLTFTGHDDEPVVLSPAEEASFARSLSEAEQGLFASDADLAAILAKYGCEGPVHAPGCR